MKLFLVFSIVMILVLSSCAQTLTPNATPITTPKTTPTFTATVMTTTPTPMPTRAEMIQQLPESQDIVTRQYRWWYAGSEWTWDLPIPQALYDYYKQRPRPPTKDYSVYVTHPEDDFYLEMLVKEIEEAAVGEGFDEWETVNFAVSFVQSLPYTSDTVTTPYDEYPRYPIETLVDYGGDCEDSSILMAAILYEMGYGVILLSPPGHMAVGVLGGEGVYGTYWEHNGKKYYYLETIGEGWRIGEIPPVYESENAYIYDIVPVPILTHSWQATTQGYYVKLVVTVENWGTATAYDTYVYAGFDAGGGTLWSARESQLFDLPSDYSIDATLYLSIPMYKYTRIVVQIIDDGYAVDESYSEWFDTY